MNISIHPDPLLFKGPGGSLPIQEKDVITRQLAMLVLGECSDWDVSKVAAMFDYSRQRYYQLLSAFNQGGASALLPSQPGPKSNYRRTSEVVRRVIAQRFHDPEASAEVIAQKLRQKNLTVSQRSVERIIADYGLQKKLYSLNPSLPPQFIESERTRRKQRSVPCDPKSLEQQVRQLLADKISGNQVGVWLLIPELLRLGAWCQRRDESGVELAV